MRMSLRSALVCASLAACTTPTQPAAPVRLAAMASAFDRGSPISFALNNTSGRTVFVAACGDHVTVILERSQGAGWQNYASGICLAIYSMVPVTLAPGALREETTTVQDSGRYRLRILVGTDLRNVNLGVVSPPFDVR
jgi:hypothetical protein